MKGEGTMRRTIIFLQRENPERLKIVEEHTEIKTDTLQPPKTILGISIQATEIETSESLGLPVVRRCLLTNQAFADRIPEPGCQFIALLCLKAGVDRSALLDCTLKQALALCETYDTAPA
jgi:hypothetical protein